MSEILKKMDTAFGVLIGMEKDLDVFLASDAANAVMQKDGKYTVKDAISALRELIQHLAGTLAERGTATLAEEAVEKAIAAMPEAAQLKLPEGSIVVHGDEPEELSILVLRKVNHELLLRLVKDAGKTLAGGSNDTLAAVERIAPARHLDHWDNRPYAFEGYPEIGSVIVKAVDEAGLLTKTTGATESESDLASLGRYLIAASRKKASVQVNLVDEGDTPETDD